MYGFLVELFSCFSFAFNSVGLIRYHGIELALDGCEGPINSKYSTNH
jgi:hypothetical protein